MVRWRRHRASALALVVLVAGASLCVVAASRTPKPTATPPPQTIEASGQILGIGIGTQMSEARAKLDPLRAPDEHQPDRKEKAGTRIYWKLKETEYDWMIAWANSKGQITRMRAMLRPEQRKAFSEIGDVSRAAVNTPEKVMWTIERPDRLSFRLVAQGEKQIASSVYMFALGLDMR